MVAIAVTRFNKVKENKRGCDVLDNREEERQRPQSSFQPCCGPIDQNCPLKWENFAFWEWKPDRDRCSDPQSPPESTGPAHGYGLCLLFLNPGLWSWKSLWISECLVGGEKSHCRDSTADANRLKIVFLPYSFYPFRCSRISRFPRQSWRQAAVQLRVEDAQQVLQDTECSCLCGAVKRRAFLALRWWLSQLDSTEQIGAWLVGSDRDPRFDWIGIFSVHVQLKACGLSVS